MSTVESKEMVKQLILDNGYYPGDPQLYRIYSYFNTMARKKVYSLQYTDNYLDEGECVSDPVLLWDRNGVTPEGKKFLKS